MDERAKSAGWPGCACCRWKAGARRRWPSSSRITAAAPIVAPSMREVPLESNTEALEFARTLAANGFDMVIFLTGVGTRALARVVETVYPPGAIRGGAAASRSWWRAARSPWPRSRNWECR